MKSIDGRRQNVAAWPKTQSTPTISRHWLKLADSWLQMLPKQAESQNWPKLSDEDSKESH
jgi:hypothetical protein